MTAPRLDPLLTFADTVLAARDWAADLILGPRCERCADRVFDRDRAAHDLTCD